MNYDVFISFKNSGDNFNRTEDCELAYEIYNELNGRPGINSFYSEESIKSIGESDYKKAIDAALD